MFLSAVWTLILTAPIHCRGSIGEQVMQWYISPNLFWWRYKIIYILDGLKVSRFSANDHFWLNYSFNWLQLTPFSKKSHHMPHYYFKPGAHCVIFLPSFTLNTYQIVQDSAQRQLISRLWACHTMQPANLVSDKIMARIMLCAPGLKLIDMLCSVEFA